MRKKSLLCIALSCALFLSGCGGSKSSDTSAAEGNDTSVATETETSGEAASDTALIKTAVNALAQ